MVIKCQSTSLVWNICKSEDFIQGFTHYTVFFKNWKISMHKIMGKLRENGLAIVFLRLQKFGKTTTKVT